MSERPFSETLLAGVLMFILCWCVIPAVSVLIGWWWHLQYLKGYVPEPRGAAILWVAWLPIALSLAIWRAWRR